MFTRGDWVQTGNFTRLRARSQGGGGFAAGGKREGSVTLKEGAPDFGRGKGVGGGVYLGQRMRV